MPHMSSKKFLRLFKNYIWTHKCVPSHMRVISHHQNNNISTSKTSSKSVRKTSKKEEKTKWTGYSFITDSSCAESIAFHISHDWKDGYIFEANPGFGVLSKAILNTSPPKFRIFEKHSEFLPALQALKNDYSNLEIVEADLFSLPYIVTKSMHVSNDELKMIFNGVQECSWKDGVPFRVYATISSTRGIKFLRFLLKSIADQSSIFSYGRCEFIFLLNENEYQYMVPDAKPSYSSYHWVTVLYNLFFEIKCLDKFSSEILFPHPTRKNKTENEEQQGFYLMKLTPNPNLLSSVVNENRFVEFYFFTRHFLAKRSNPVIPALETWIPSSGPRLIKQGMKVYTKFCDLDLNQLLHLFNQFSSWPEYEKSTFHTAMQEFYRKKK